MVYKHYHKQTNTKQQPIQDQLLTTLDRICSAIETLQKDINTINS